MSIKTIKTKVRFAQNALHVPKVIPFHSDVYSIAKNICKVARRYFEFQCNYEELVEMIRASSLPAFRICPFSSRQYPVIFFLSPHLEKVLLHIDHIIAHEVLHLKHGLFREDNVPYFVRQKDLDLWKKAGYNAFLLEEYFGDLVKKFDISVTLKLVSGYGERLRDSYVNSELIINPVFQKHTEKWMKQELFIATREEVSKYKCKSDASSIFNLKLLALDSGIKLALLSKSLSARYLERKRPKFRLYYKEGERIVNQIRELFERIKYAYSPYNFAQQVMALDDIVRL